jgi:hypothetical protein
MLHIKPQTEITLDIPECPEKYYSSFSKEKLT